MKTSRKVSRNKEDNYRTKRSGNTNNIRIYCQDICMPAITIDPQSIPKIKLEKVDNKKINHRKQTTGDGLNLYPQEDGFMYNSCKNLDGHPS